MADYLEDPGFALNVATGEYHKKYAEHARGLRRTTTLGMFNILGDRPGTACPECFPPPPKAAKKPKEEAKAVGLEVTPDELVFDGPDGKG